MRRIILLAVVLGILAIAAPTYYHVGWSRMVAACGVRPPEKPAWHHVHYSWSWSPVGFQCTYDNGRQRSSLWF